MESDDGRWFGWFIVGIVIFGVFILPIFQRPFWMDYQDAVIENFKGLTLILGTGVIVWLLLPKKDKLPE